MNKTQDEQLTASKIRNLDSLTAIREFNLGVKKGEYLLAAEVEKEHAEEVARVKSKLLAIPAKLTPQVTGLTATAEVYSLLSSAIDEVLNELAE